MKLSISALALLLAVMTGFGWSNHRHITTLRATRQDLAAQAAARGIVLDTGRASAPRTKIPRPERPAKAAITAAEFIAYAEEMHPLAPKTYATDETIRQRMTELMDRVSTLDGKQLRVLIDEIIVAEITDEEIRRRLLAFSLHRLANNSPRIALDVLINSPVLRDVMDNNKRHSVDTLIGRAVWRWAGTHPTEALAWFRDHQDDLSEQGAEGVKSSLMWGTVASDPQLAFQLFDEFGRDPERVPGMLIRDYQSPESKAACVAPLREWCAGIEDEALRERVYYNSLAKLALGADSQSVDFQSATQWAASAKLTPKDLELFTRTDLLDLSYYIKPEEAGQWIAWMGETFPTTTSSHRISQLFANHRTRQAAEEWIRNAPPSPAKHAAIRAYAASIARRDQEAATALLRKHEVPPE